ncbi:hypothetical protein [Acinetobacter sp.]|uniref:hypothetical protein n=1 Tax=Acinetobacter sp. TaxID=472 RepID=UPI000C0BA9C0|nr:hypothetical protein [Acinetobacter sp.]MAK30307.1 hypothetical protein [Acinetobacter sp.]
MGMTVQQRPDTANVHGVFEQLMYVITSTEQASASNYKFRYIADLYVGGVMVSRVKIFPNQAGAGVFRVDKLLVPHFSTTNAYQGTSAGTVVQAASIFNTGAVGGATTKIFSSSNGESVRQIEVKFGQEYASSATANPTVYLNQVTGEYINLFMSAGLRRSNTWDDGILSYTSNNSWANAFLMKQFRSFFLSDRTEENTQGYTSNLVSSITPILIDVEYKQPYVLGFLNDNTAPYDSDLKSIYVALYNSSNVLLDSRNFIPGTDGGVENTAVSADKDKLQFFGCGPFNFMTQTIDTTFKDFFVNEQVSYYEVCAVDGTATTPSATTDLVSTIYRFNINTCESIYQDSDQNPIYIAWQNSLGCWDFQYFSLRHTYSDKITRKTFDQVAGNWNTADAAQDFEYRGTQGGTRIARVDATQELTATTNLLQDSDVAVLETLMLSPQVFLFSTNRGEGITPITVTDATYVKKRRVNERAPFLYQIKFKFAKPRPTTKGGTFRGLS